jgi:hypothetical protein
MAKGAASLASLCLVLVPAGVARSGALATLPVRVGDSLLVQGTNLACAETAVGGGLAFSCLQQSPSRPGTIRPDSMGVGISSGGVERASILVVDETGRLGLGWVRRQPPHSSSGTFPAGRSTRTLTAVPGDRLALAGTNLACAVDTRDRGPVITCAEVDTTTFEPIAGTYAIAADARRVEIERVTKTGPFRVVVGFDQPWRGH